MHLGDIEKIGGEIPLPSDKIAEIYRKTRKGLQVEINLPGDVNGAFVWNREELRVEGRIQQAGYLYSSLIQIFRKLIGWLGSP